MTVLPYKQREGGAMNPVVTARIPENVRIRGNEVLHEIGSTPSELINAAFEYVIREKKLPEPEHRLERGERRPSASQAEQVAAFMDDIRVPVPAEWNDLSFDELFDSAMKERYASLH
jgi:antitoxin component of RelBE/YafQ-DinJ toxin-antitoxin module